MWLLAGSKIVIHLRLGGCSTNSEANSQDGDILDWDFNLNSTSAVHVYQN